MSEYFGDGGDMNGDSDGCGMVIAAFIMFCVLFVVAFLAIGGGA